jgi:hypothetical protein
VARLEQFAVPQLAQLGSKVTGNKIKLKKYQQCFIFVTMIAFSSRSLILIYCDRQ